MARFDDAFADLTPIKQAAPNTSNRFADAFADLEQQQPEPVETEVAQPSQQRSTAGGYLTQPPVSESAQELTETPTLADVPEASAAKQGYSYQTQPNDSRNTFVSEEEERKNLARFDRLAQGATFNTSDEIIGGARAALTDETYEEARDDIREGMESREDAIGGGEGLFFELVGSLPSGGIGAKAIAKGKTLLNRTGRAAAVGAGHGSASAAGASDADVTSEEFRTDVAQGAAIGSVFGVGGEVVGAGASAIAKSPVGDLFRNDYERNASKAIQSALRKAEETGTLNRASVERNLATLDKIGSETRGAYRGDGGALADVEPLSDLFRESAVLSRVPEADRASLTRRTQLAGDAAQQVVSPNRVVGDEVGGATVTARDLNRSDEFTSEASAGREEIVQTWNDMAATARQSGDNTAANALEEAGEEYRSFSSPEAYPSQLNADTYKETVEKQLSTYKTNSGDVVPVSNLYESAMRTTIPQETLDEVSRLSDASSFISTAITQGRIRATEQVVSRTGGAQTRPSNFQVLHEAKRYLDAQSTTYTRGGDTSQAGIYSKHSKKLSSLLKDLSEDYSDAQEIVARAKTAANDIELGTGSLTQSKDKFENMVKSVEFNSPEQERVALGMGNVLRDKLEKGTRGSNGKLLADKDVDRWNKLHGDTPNTSDLSQVLNAEQIAARTAKIADTKSASLGNKLLDSYDPRTMGADAAVAIGLWAYFDNPTLVGLAMVTSRFGYTAAAKRSREQLAKAVQTELLKTGAKRKSIDDFLQGDFEKISKEQLALMGRTVTSLVSQQAGELVAD